MLLGKPDYKLVGQLIISHEVDGNYASTGTDVYGCSQCGALVFDQEKHNRSHVGSAIGLGI